MVFPLDSINFQRHSESLPQINHFHPHGETGCAYSSSTLKIKDAILNCIKYAKTVSWCVFTWGTQLHTHLVICSGSQTRGAEGSNSTSCRSSSMGRAAEAGAGGWHGELGCTHSTCPGTQDVATCSKQKRAANHGFLCSVGKARREQSLRGAMLHCSAFRAAMAFAVCAPACVASGLAGGCNLLLHAISTVIFTWSACCFLS